jgi:hypothetical protein
MLHAVIQILTFALLAKERNVRQSVKGSNLGYNRSIVQTVVITLTVYQLQHNLLYKAGLQI